MTPEGEASRSERYSAIKTRFYVADLFLTFASLVAFQVFLSRPLQQAASGSFTGFYAACFFYMAVLYFFMYLVGLPLHFTSSFIVEHRFDLSTQSIFAWCKDELKSLALSLALWEACIIVFYFVLRTFPSLWWVIAALLWIFFSIVLARVLPVLLIPIFYKYSPVEEGPLKERILALAERCSLSLLNVYQIDFSKKTRKANAALVGMGKTKRVVLADTLVNEFSPAEAESVVAHEFGHSRYRHIWQLLFFSGAVTLLAFFLLFLSAHRIVEVTGASGLSDLYLFPVLMLLLFIFGLAILPAQNFFSRCLERQADRYAMDMTGDTDTFISVMRKLSEMNLAEEEPSLLKKIFMYDHPPVGERIRMAEEISRENKKNP